MAPSSGMLAEARPEGPDRMGVEIAAGPDAAIATIQEVKALEPELRPMLAGAARIVLVGTGASLAVARIAAPIWRRSHGWRVPVVVRQATEIALGDLDGLAVEPGDVTLAISQSGASPETLAAARLARAGGAPVLALTAHPAAPLASSATLTIPLASGAEEGAATKSALASLAALLAMARAVGGHEATTHLRLRLPAGSAWDEAVAAAPRLATARHTWMLGFGAADGLAAAAALLWHEKVIRPATVATPSEFRHGLIETVDATDVVVVITGVNESRTEAEDRYLERLRGELRELDVDAIELEASTPGPALAALELLFRLQHVARATALAAATYREEFAILRRVVKPANDLLG